MNLTSPRVRLTLIAIALLGGTTAALAAGHFVRGPSASIDSDGNLTISWKEAGLGDTVSSITRPAPTPLPCISA